MMMMTMKKEKTRQAHPSHSPQRALSEGRAIPRCYSTPSRSQAILRPPRTRCEGRAILRDRLTTQAILLPQRALSEGRAIPRGYHTPSRTHAILLPPRNRCEGRAILRDRVTTQAILLPQRALSEARDEQYRVAIPHHLERRPSYCRLEPAARVEQYHVDG
jgi:hypothetical protein